MKPVRKAHPPYGGGDAVAFWIGALGYPLIELAWRRRTHPAMALAGGLAMLALERIALIYAGWALWHQALLGGWVITGIEYGIGQLLNRRYQIWDYRQTPLNVQGQICLPFTFAWCMLSAGVLLLLRLSRS